jgi:hypothetical protein
MDSVTVRIRAAEFSATMAEISEWLYANRYQPIRYKFADITRMGPRDRRFPGESCR